MINKEIQIFENEQMGFKVRTILNEDKSISMNAEDTAIGYGWCRTEIKNDKAYNSILWSRMNGYIKDLGFAHVCAKDDFIPESLFYLLGMKAGSESAMNYQKWLACEVIPSIRKHGAFIADNENIDEEFVRNELRFSKRRTIKTFTNANMNDLKKLYEEFRSYIDDEFKYKTDERVARYKSVEKGLDGLHDRLIAEDTSNVGDCYNVRKLKERVILDRTTLEKRISGGEKAGMTREISRLNDEIENIKSNDEDENID